MKLANYFATTNSFKQQWSIVLWNLSIQPLHWGWPRGIKRLNTLLSIVRVGNYIEIRNGYYAPFNDKNQRIAMKENGYINVYENLLPNESKDLFIKREVKNMI